MTAQWLMKFARSEPSTWTAELISDYEKNWLEFLGPGQQTSLKKWHQGTRSFLEDLEAGKKRVELCRLWRQISIEAGQVKITCSTSPDSGKEMYLTKVMDAFEAAGRDMMLCRREDCRKLFVRTKRQEYCSETCRGTVGKRKYRKSHKLS